MDMFGYAATLLGVSWFTWGFTFQDACALQLEQVVSFQWLWSPWIIGQGASLSSGNAWPSSDAIFYTELHTRLYEQKADGSIFCALSADDLVQFGMPLGAAKHWLTGLDDCDWAAFEPMEPTDTTSYILCRFG